MSTDTQSIFSITDVGHSVAAQPARIAQRLPVQTFAQRARLYAMMILLCTLAAVGMRWMQDGRSLAGINFITSDARGYYVYLPSMVIDGDLDFENQVRNHWDTESKYIPQILSRRTPLGLVRNKYTMGLSLTLFVPFAMAHGLTHALHPLAPEIFRPDGYSVLYQLTCLLCIQLMALGTLLMADAWITRQFRLRPQSIALASILILMGSNYAWYVIREPFMVHVTSTFWMTACLLLVTLITAAAQQGRPFGKMLAYLGLCSGMAVICRPSNVIIVPVLVWMFIQLHQSGRLWQRGTLILAIVAGILSILPVLAQMSVWHTMTGQWIYQGYEGETFRWTEPRLLKTLFSSLHGLFTWTPLYLLPVMGIAWAILKPQALSITNRLTVENTTNPQAHSETSASPSGLVKFLGLHVPANHLAPTAGRRSLLVALSISALLMWYVNSAWHCWYFGWAFGGRAFLELLPVFILGLAMLLDRSASWQRAGRRILAGFILLAVIFNFCLMLAYQMRWVPKDDYLWGTPVLQEDPDSFAWPGL